MKPELHLNILASGSKGNAYLVEGPEATFLVDCGISLKQIRLRAAELGCDLENIAGMLITHEHSDHVAGLSVVANHVDAPLFATAGTIAARSYLSRLSFEVITHDEAFELAGVRIQAFPTSHDVADPVGFTFETANDKLAICTDTGYVVDKAAEALYGARILALESNHDERMLAKGPYPAHLKQRVAGQSGHLSNVQAAEILPDLVSSDTEIVVGMHLSQQNNVPSLAVRTLAQAVGAEPIDDVASEARTPDAHLSVVVAGQDRPMRLY